MKYTKFLIKNFKGINELVLDLTKAPNGKIFPLVGLNESGKTTILEAINFFQEDWEDGKELEIIHKRDSGGFTGDIEVKAFLSLDEEDKKFITSFLSKNNLNLENEMNEIIISKKYNYKDGTFNENKANLWNFNPDLITKTSRQKNFSKLYSSNEKLWNELTDEIKKIIPKILYFENFIFKFPEKIYLEEVPNPTYSGEEKEKQIKYRRIMEDILKTCNESYSRIKLIGKLKSSDEGEKDSGKQMLTEMETEINKKILEPWNQIFPNSPNKRISINFDIESAQLYLQIKITEGSSIFNLNERSLGFRWFFGFILFTEFRKVRDGESGEYLFLFDEPASNLHEGSQLKLLNLFEEVTKKAKIIYSTHSPYLLNTKFLLNTFIVKDDGRINEGEYEYRQKINATRYAQFVGNYPNEESHFKPFLDVLEYVDNPFIQTNKIVFFEGKFDYCTFKWIQNILFKDDYEFKLYPGASVDKYENIFREYLAHTKKFVAIFDGDGNSIRGGKGAQKRYINNISKELEKYIFTLKDVDESYDGFTTEKLFTEDEKFNIQKTCPNFTDDTTYNKGHFNTAIQELFIKNETFVLSAGTKTNFKKIFDFIVIKLGELE